MQGTKFHVVPPTKMSLECLLCFFFISALAVFLVELRWTVAVLSLFLCPSLSLFS